MASSRSYGTARRQNRRRRTQIAVLAVIAVVFPATALSAWTVLRDGEGSDGTPPAVVEPDATPSPTEGSPAPTSSSDLTWVDHDGTPLPVSASAGPARQDGPLDVGYADTDLGAALAAVHIAYAAGPSAGPASFRVALDRQVTGPAQRDLLVTVERDYAETRAELGVPDGKPLPAGDATLLGYQVSALPDENRHVQLVLTSPAADGATNAYAVDVVMTRQEGDWRLIAPSDGTWNSAVTLLGAAPSAVPGGVTRFDRVQPAPASLGGDR